MTDKLRSYEVRCWTGVHGEQTAIVNAPSSGDAAAMFEQELVRQGSTVSAWTAEEVMIVDNPFAMASDHAARVHLGLPRIRYVRLDRRVDA